MNFNITELKKHLGPGLGLRKNKYMIEIPVPIVQGETLNMLCQAAGLPERSISTTEMWHKGRKYTVRGETDYGGEYTISLIDDDKMNIRQMFDAWLKHIDNTRMKEDKEGSLLGASYEEVSPTLLDELSSSLSFANSVINGLNSPRQIADFVIGVMDVNSQLSAATYQTDINIWQLGGGGTQNEENKVYGYKLQNAFPKSVGIVTLDDNVDNGLSEFSVTFAYSEFIPLRGIRNDIIGGIIGDQGTDILQGTNALLNNI